MTALASGRSPTATTAAVPLVLLGPGKVGQALVGLLLERGEQLARRAGLRVELTAVADSSGIVQAERGGLTDAALRRVLRSKMRGEPLRAWPAARDGAVAVDTIDPRASEAYGVPPILVDTSAADTTPSLLDARERGWYLALANKLPLTGAIDAFDRLTRHGSGARWETTVASSLPVVATLQTLLDRGDTVRWISGALSGTLGFIAREMERGQPFSAAVTQAVGLGLTEPDPSEDVSGHDVARKALILARMLGYRLELDAVDLAGLVAPVRDASDMQAFLARLTELDGEMERRVAAAGGGALRFLATIGQGRVRVGLVGVDDRSPLGAVDPGNSVVVFETDCYSTHPLVLSGRGGGPQAAAMGVLGDVMSLARASLREGGRATVTSP